MAALFFARRWKSVDLDFVRIECEVTTDKYTQLTTHRSGKLWEIYSNKGQSLITITFQNN